ncbi:MAG: hypothetical protein JOZ47_10580 [Kutzneria sp.]|nr:hypothetical protein [Kutzneria sp.]MBV9845505.1 hypothetical protein [Kutzneria sp.]
MNTDDGDLSDDDRDDLEDEGVPQDDAVRDVHEPRTVCHFCGGVGEIAHPLLGVIGGAPRTVNAGRECPLCEGSSALAGMTPPI